MFKIWATKTSWGQVKRTIKKNVGPLYKKLKGNTAFVLGDLGYKSVCFKITMVGKMFLK